MVDFDDYKNLNYRFISISRGIDTNVKFAIKRQSLLTKQALSNNENGTIQIFTSLVRGTLIRKIFKALDREVIEHCISNE